MSTLAHISDVYRIWLVCGLARTLSLWQTKRRKSNAKKTTVPPSPGRKMQKVHTFACNMRKFEEYVIICRFARKLCQFWFQNQCELLTLLHPNHNLLLVSGAKDRQRMMDHGGPQDKIDHSLPSPTVAFSGSTHLCHWQLGQFTYIQWKGELTSARISSRQMSRAEGHCKGQRCAKSLCCFTVSLDQIKPNPIQSGLWIACRGYPKCMWRVPGIRVWH